MSITHILQEINILLSVLLIGGVLLQQSDAGMGGTFGGGDYAVGHHTKRGAEKVIFIGTIIVSILFAVTSFSLLLV